MFAIVTTYVVVDEEGDEVDALSRNYPVFVRPDRASAIAKARNVAASIVTAEYDGGYATSFHSGEPTDDNLESIAIYDEGSEDGGADGETFGKMVGNVYILSVVD